MNVLTLFLLPIFSIFLLSLLSSYNPESFYVYAEQKNTTSHVTHEIIGKLRVIAIDGGYGDVQSDPYVYTIGMERNNNEVVYFKLKFNNALYSSFSDKLAGTDVEIVGDVDDASRIVFVKLMYWPPLENYQKNLSCPLDSIRHYIPYSKYAHLYTHFVNHTTNYLSHCVEKGQVVISPLIQRSIFYIPSQDVVCNENLFLLISPSESSYCVKQSTISELLKRGWSRP